MSRIAERVRTDRLVAERPVPEHAEGLAAVLAEPGVGDWLWPGELGGPRTPAQARDLLEADMAAWESEGWGPWIVRDAANGRVLGRAGLAQAEVDGRPAVELAWYLTEARWGEGLATEVAREAVHAAFEDLGLDELVAVTLVDNRASQGVMQKLGMAIEREVEHAGLPHVLARLRRSRAPAGRRR